jgi:hypothetical protein
MIVEHNNNPDSSYKLSLNTFADWSPHEMISYLSFNEPAIIENESEENLQAVNGLQALSAPASVDWRT